MRLISLGIDAVERGLLPDLVARTAIRRQCDQRLRDFHRGMDQPTGGSKQWAFVESMRVGRIATVSEKANIQHYDLPPEFFAAVLSPRRKYSCCFWPSATTTLAEAEAKSLGITCDRADLTDGQQILKLGCGLGSMSLWMAKRYVHGTEWFVSHSLLQPIGRSPQ